MTSLTVLLADAAATTISTAKKLYSIVGAANSGYPFYATTFGSSTGYGEIHNTNFTGWNAGASIGSQSGNGFLWDVTTLEGQQILSGNWSPTIRLTSMLGGSPTGTISCSILVRASKYSSGGTYTTIMTATATGQTLTSTATTFNLPATSASAVNFSTGDKLYIDIWLNITGTTGGANAVRLNRLSTDTTNLTGDPNAQIVTPGYQPSATARTQSVASRFLLALNHTQSIPARFRLALGHVQSVGTRLLQSLTHTQSVGTRLRLANRSNKYAGTRFRQALPGTRSIPARFLRAIGQIRSIGTRFRLALGQTQGMMFLLRLATSRTQNVQARFRQALGTSNFTLIRIRQSLLQIPSSRMRLRQANVHAQATMTRFRLAIPPPPLNASAYVPNGSASGIVTSGTGTAFLVNGKASGQGGK